MSYGVRKTVSGFGCQVNEATDDYIPALVARTQYESNKLRTLIKKQITRPVLSAAEFGCGYGRLTPVLCEFARWVDAFERDAELVRLALHNTHMGYLLKFHHVESLSRTGATDQAYDLILSFTVIQHHDDQEARATCLEIQRVLAPGGLLVLCEDADISVRDGTWGRSLFQYKEMLPELELVHMTDRFVEKGMFAGRYMLFRRPGDLI